MKVLLVNTKDKGGAANACIRLHLALLNEGVDSTLLTLFKTRDNLPHHYSYAELVPQKRFLVRKVFRKLERIFLRERHFTIANIKLEARKYLDGFTTNSTEFYIEEIPDIEKYDVINLHWVNDFLNWKSFFGSKKIKNVVWSLHDMSPFTGGYPYSGGYKGYELLDSDPPFLKNSPDPDFASKQLKEKIEILTKTTIKIYVVALSNWLLDCSRSSKLFRVYDHSLIPNSVDTSIFTYQDSKRCKQELNLPLDKKIVFFVSEQLENKRKGFRLLLDAFNNLDQNEYLLCGVGKSNSNLTDFFHLGVINDEHTMVKAYAAADLFVLPAIEDNLPNVVVEALCCGTPVAGFAIGGMVDMVENGRNGYLSDDISSKGMVELIDKFFQKGIELSREEISIEASKNYSYEVQSSAFVSLFTNIVRG